MEILQTVLGSETEFGIVPRDGRWLRDNPEAIGEQMIDAFNWLFNRIAYDRYRTLFNHVNWWNEHISGRAYDADVARCLGMTGQYAENGARLYLDGAHPEYSTPECATPLEVVAYERAGEEMMRAFTDELEDLLHVRVDLVKNNWDYLTSSYACHENYLLSRELFQNLVLDTSLRSSWHGISPIQIIWIAHLVTRILYTGSGGIRGDDAWPACFVLSQRAPFIDHFIGLNTTYGRSLINTRDRPYADQGRFARLHVICSDSNRSDWSNVSKYGTSRLVLLMFEDILTHRFSVAHDQYFLSDPVQFFHELNSVFSRGSRYGKIYMAARDIQLLLLTDVMRWLVWKEREGYILPWAQHIVAQWALCCEALGNHAFDDLDTKLDYRVKYALFEKETHRGKPLTTLRSLDYSYHVVHRYSLFDKLISKGIIESLITPEYIASAHHTPPQTRAALRKRITHALRHDTSYELITTWHALFLMHGLKEIGRVSMPDPRSSAIFTFSPASLEQIAPTAFNPSPPTSPFLHNN